MMKKICLCVVKKLAGGRVPPPQGRQHDREGRGARKASMYEEKRKMEEGEEELP